MEIRLNKYLSSQGVCSRREADRLIADGRVLVGGKAAGLGAKLSGGEVITIDGKPAGPPVGEEKAKPVLLLFNKPAGVVCTTSDRDRAVTVMDMIEYPVRVYPVGRLDKDSEGLLLLTNQGDLANEIIHAGNFHEKEYLVTLDRPCDAAFLQKLRGGVYLKELKVTTRPCEVEAVEPKVFRIVLTQGLNRQIRRMCGALGYRVVALRRERILNLRLGRLHPGDFRKAAPEEVRELKELLAAGKKA